MRISSCTALVAAFCLLSTTNVAADLAADKRTCRMALATYQNAGKPSIDLLAELSGKANDSATPSVERITSLFAKRRLKVNTDGAGRSYHQLDPRGSASALPTRRALNNICNGGVKVTNEAGERLDCRSEADRDEYYANFDKLRRNGWKPLGNIRVTFNPYITEVRAERMFFGKRYQIPCVTQSGSYKGYFVSVTGLQNTTQPVGCNPGRYIDSLKVKSIVVPKDWVTGPTTIADIVFSELVGEDGKKRANGPVRNGDLVMLYNQGVRKDGSTFSPKSRVVYGIVGEGGPEGELGEASIAMNKELLGVAKDPSTRAEAFALDTGNIKVSMLILPNTKKALGGRYTTANIDQHGRSAFARWGRGGQKEALARFKACERVLAAGEAIF